jgi:cytochrome c5
MSDSNHAAPDSHEVHEGPIKTPKQLIWTVVASFVVPIIIIIMLTNFVASGSKPAAGSEGLGAEATAQRIQPVGRFVLKDLSDTAAMKTGEQVYAAQCSACHTAGVAGAPKLGDAEAWAPRIKTGFEALWASALKGKGAMGPQGGGDHSDFEIARAVVYITNKAGAGFPEPKAPAANAAPAAAAAAPAEAPAATAAPAAPVAATPTPAAAPAATTQTAAAAAPALYATCGACHGAGVAGAPKLGDKAAWAPRLALGIDGLTASVIKGKGAMPPRGGSAGTDAEIKATVAYMVDSVK